MPASTAYERSGGLRGSASSCVMGSGGRPGAALRIGAVNPPDSTV